METSDPTRIKHGPTENLGIVPASPPPVEPELYERSPTLMAGEVPGSQGSVRVWSPNRKLLWLTIVGSGLLTLLCAFGVFALHLYSLLYFLIPAGGFSVSIASLRRPRLVVTDEAGIAITTKAGSTALRWEDIATATHASSPARILICAPHPVEIALSGFPAPVRKELMDTIIGRARLVPHALRNPNVMYISERTIAQLEHDDEDIRHEISAGRKIQAIKLYRQRYGTGLKESKDVIDLMALDVTLSDAKTALRSGQAPGSERTVAQKGHADHDIRHEIAAGRKIEAIKLYRQRYGTGLKESKEAIDVMSLDLALSDTKTALRSGRSPTEARAALTQLIVMGDTAQAASVYRQWTNSSRHEATEAIRLLQTPAALSPPTPDQAK